MKKITVIRKTNQLGLPTCDIFIVGSKDVFVSITRFASNAVVWIVVA